jgi:YceI-like domain
MYRVPLSCVGECRARTRPQSTSIIVLFLLTACTAAPPAVTPQGVQGTLAGTLQPPAGSRAYTIDRAASLIEVLVYREGALASAGHNHVIAVRDLAGTAWLAPDLADSIVQMDFSVEGLSVDEPELRAAAGADFPPGVPDSARDGTRSNMRGPNLLDAAQFPTLHLQARLTGTHPPQQLALATTVTIKGKDVPLIIPLQLERSADTLVASGELPLSQSTLGLTPFNVMLGALRVRDEMQMRYRIVARAAR